MRLVLATFCLPAAGAGAAHPFHVSRAEVEWKRDAGNLEIALQVHPEDLELAVRRHSKLPIPLDEKAEPHVRRYLEDAFVVMDREGKRMRVDWLGMEISVKDAWLYFEVPIGAAASMEARISNRFFFELQADQANTINFRSGTHRVSVTCTRERSEHVLAWSVQ